MDLLYLSLLFAGYSVAFGWDSTHGDYEKRQLVPLPRIGRSYTEEKRQGLIPSPRVGRSSMSSYNGIETDCSLTPELCNELMDRDPHEVHEAIPVLRIGRLSGRRKKSFTEDYSNDMNADDFELTKTLRSNPWDFDVNPNFFERNVRQLIPAPRVGRSANIHTNQMRLISGYNTVDDDDVDPIDLQLRAAFIPRLGKRTTHKSLDQSIDSDDIYKRAAAFTPRIGRAAFTPRIGKKASFVPRIGRSSA